MAKRVMRRTRPSPLARLGRVLYRLLVALSAVIVVLYLAVTFISQPPSTADGNEAAGVLPSDSGAGVQQPDANGRVRKEKTWTFLLAASDQASGNADTIMVGMYDTINQKVGLVSIPRDTLIAKKPYKINSMYHGGPEPLMEAVSDLLGIPIDHYVTIDIGGFKALVDAVDGIDFEVPVDMSYDDLMQDLHIHFSAGMTHLDGQEAMEVCRFRHNNSWEEQVAYSDVERTQTQQAVLSAIAGKVLSNPHKLGEYIQIFYDYVETDLSLGNVLWFAEPAVGFELSTGLSTATLPGDGTVTYKGYTYCYELYPEETLEIINEMINPYTTPITLDMTNIIQS